MFRIPPPQWWLKSPPPGFKDFARRMEEHLLAEVAKQPVRSVGWQRLLLAGYAWRSLRLDIEEAETDGE